MPSRLAVATTTMESKRRSRRHCCRCVDGCRCRPYARPVIPGDRASDRRSRPGRLAAAIATPSGRIDIDEDAIAAIVRDAVRSRYGVVAIGRPRRGSPIATVARKVIETVTFQIKRTLGIGVDRVDVNIGGLRLSDCAAGSLA